MRRAARDYLLMTGRSPGGRPTYGWRLVPNPEGPGKVVAQDPARIDWVRGMVERALRGDSVYSIATWLNDSRAPVAHGATAEKWRSSSVERMLSNPRIAGMTSYNPGYSKRGGRGPEVLRDDEGRPVISGDAIIGVEQFEKLQHLLAHKQHHAAIPVAKRRSNSPLLSLIATCASCGVFLHRSGGRRLVLRCRRCGQSITHDTLARYVSQRLLTERGSLPMYGQSWAIPDDPNASRRLAGIDLQITTTALALTDDHADTRTLAETLDRLKRQRSLLRDSATGPSAQVLLKAGRTLEQVWRLCTTDEQRREILRAQVDSMIISKPIANVGGAMARDRIAIRWSRKAKPTVPRGVSLNAMYSETVQAPEWISFLDAAAYPNCGSRSITRAISDGEIAQRETTSRMPSLLRTSVERFSAKRSQA